MAEFPLAYDSGGYGVEASVNIARRIRQTLDPELLETRQRASIFPSRYRDDAEEAKFTEMALTQISGYS